MHFICIYSLFSTYCIFALTADVLSDQQNSLRTSCALETLAHLVHFPFGILPPGGAHKRDTGKGKGAV